MRRVQRIVLMGGSFQRQFREWNIVCDPLSAKRVMEFEGEVVCIGLDVTSQTRLSRRQHEMLLGQKAMKSGRTCPGWWNFIPPPPAIRRSCTTR